MTGAGQLNRRLRIEHYVETQDALGAQLHGWLPFTTVWAMRQDGSDGERMAAHGLEATRMTRWKVRSSSKTRTVDAKMRCMFEGQIYEITGVSETPEGRNRFLWISTIVRADEGQV